MKSGKTIHWVVTYTVVEVSIEMMKQLPQLLLTEGETELQEEVFKFQSTIRMYIYIYVCMYVCMYVCAYRRCVCMMYVNIYTCLYA